VLRFFGEGRDDAPEGRDDDRLLVVNLGRQLEPLVPEPLLAPPEGRQWKVLWSSEHPGYGGAGTPEVETTDGTWRIPAEAAFVFHPVVRHG